MSKRQASTSWMGKKNAAKREAQRVQDTADIVAEGWAPPVAAHDARMATDEDVCNSPDHDHSRELTDAEVDVAPYAQQKDLVPAAGQGDEVGYYEPGGEGERRATAFWEHGLPPVEEFEREIYERLEAETGWSWRANDARWRAAEVDPPDREASYPSHQAAEADVDDATRLSRRLLASLREGDIDNGRLQITALADLTASTDETPGGQRDRAAQELEAYQSMADRFHQGEPARSAGEAEMFEFFRESCPDQDREAE